MLFARMDLMINFSITYRFIWFVASLSVKIDSFPQTETRIWDFLFNRVCIPLSNWNNVNFYL